MIGLVINLTYQVQGRRACYLYLLQISNHAIAQYPFIHLSWHISQTVLNTLVRKQCAQEAIQQQFKTLLSLHHRIPNHKEINKFNVPRMFVHNEIQTFPCHFLFHPTFFGTAAHLHFLIDVIENTPSPWKLL